MPDGADLLDDEADPLDEAADLLDEAADPQGQRPRTVEKGPAGPYKDGNPPKKGRNLLSNEPRTANEARDLALVARCSSRAHVAASADLEAPSRIGHLGMLAQMDRAAEDGGPPMVFVRAVGYHVAGDVAKAERLYKEAGLGDFRVVENLAALERGAPPKHFPSAADLTKDSSISTWDVIWRGSFSSPTEAGLSDFDRMIVIPGRAGAFLLYLALLLLAASWILRSELSALPAKERAPSVASHVLLSFVLGSGWIRLGRPFVALFVATLFAFFTVAVLVCATAGIEAGNSRADYGRVVLGFELCLAITVAIVMEAGQSAQRNLPLEGLLGVPA